MPKEKKFAATDAAIKTACSSLELLAKNGKSLSRYVFVGAKGGENRKGEDICFANIMGQEENFEGWSKNGGCFATAYLGSTASGHCKYDDNSLLWLRYICSLDSPWKELIPHLVTADAETIQLNHGFIFQDLENLDGQVMFSFLSAARLPGEKPEKFQVWKSLIEAGIHPTVAYLIGSNLVGKDMYSKRGYFSCHEALDQAFLLDSTQNFIAGTPKIDTPFFRYGFRRIGALMTRMFKGDVNQKFSDFWERMGNGPFSFEKVLITCRLLIEEDKEKFDKLVKEFKEIKDKPPKAKKITFLFDEMNEEAA